MEKTYNVSEAAEKIGVSVKTLQRWDRDGKLVANRTPSNRRFYTESQMMEVLNMERNTYIITMATTEENIKVLVEHLEVNGFEIVCSKKVK